jgi:ATP-binding cassette, subfamily B, multidrug efflux pump
MIANSNSRNSRNEGGMRRGPMGPMGAMGRPVEKAKDFSGTLKRLLLYFVP